MKRSQFFDGLRQRHIRLLAVAGATAALFFIQAAAILVVIFEAASWAMKALVRPLTLGRVHAPVRRLDRSAKY